MRKRKHDLPVGVYPHPNSEGRYLSALRVNGRRVYLGVFDTVAEAEAKALQFRAEHPSKRGNPPWKPGDKI